MSATTFVSSTLEGQKTFFFFAYLSAINLKIWSLEYHWQFVSPENPTGQPVDLCGFINTDVDKFLIFLFIYYYILILKFYFTFFPLSFRAGKGHWGLLPIAKPLPSVTKAQHPTSLVTSGALMALVKFRRGNIAQSGKGLRGLAFVQRGHDALAQGLRSHIGWGFRGQ